MNSKFSKKAALNRVRVKRRVQEQIVTYLRGITGERGLVLQEFHGDTIHLRLGGVDFWPATHRWWNMYSGRTGHGLLEFLEEAKIAPPFPSPAPWFYGEPRPFQLQLGKSL